MYTGNYSRLACEIQFVRSMGYYLIQIYIPSGLIVIISWVSFWLNRNATPARVALGVTTVSGVNGSFHYWTFSFLESCFLNRLKISVPGQRHLSLFGWVLSGKPFISSFDKNTQPSFLRLSSFIPFLGLDDDNTDVLNKCSPPQDFLCKINRCVSRYLFRHGLRVATR